jgi:hypothetical protein
MADVKNEFTEAGSIGRTAAADVTAAIDGAKHVSPGGPADAMAAATPTRVLTPFDPDAT